MTFRICSRCVLDNKDIPDIVFDSDGVCEYCLEWMETEKKRKQEAQNKPWILHKLRGNDEYDCLLGLSGGVDSSLVLHYLIENDIRPICFSMDNGWNDAKADENIMRLVETLKVPFYRYALDVDKFKGLQAAFIKSGVKNLEATYDHVLMAASYEMAEKYGVKYIVGGGNHATEGIMPEVYGYQARDLRSIKGIYKAMTGKELEGLPTLSLLGYLRARFLKGIQVINLLDYYEYDREEAKKLLSEKYGWQDYGEKHCENIFTSWFQNFYLPTKWGLDKRKPHYSSMINSGQMTREEALEKLAYAPVYPELGLEQRALSYPKRTYKDFPNSEKVWKLLSDIYALRRKR